MKCDGHAKLTNAALTKLFSKCSVDLPARQNACKLPDFQPSKKYWSVQKISNSTDNLSASIETIWDIVKINIPALHNFKGYLTERVVAIDLDPVYLPNHIRDDGQRFHFMRAANESAKAAYKNAVGFIKTNADAWVNQTLRIKYNKYPVINSSLREKGIENMALAIHSLQDAFSPGHVERTPSRNPAKPGVILDVFVFEKAENKTHHSKDDYSSGSTVSVEGEMAINATVDLLLLCIKAVANDTYILNDWMGFQERWLQFKN